MSITPKEAFEAIQVLWPSVVVIKKTGDLGWTAYRKGNMAHAQGWEHPIEWGNETQYPPPPEEWVDAVFPDDVGKEGRLSNNKDAWTCEMIRGRNMYGDWICDSGLRRNCQVRKVKT
jgi:hypothetical protein